MNPLFPPLLDGSGRVLVLGAGSIAIGRALYRREDLEGAFVRLLAAAILLAFFPSLVAGLFALSDSLTHFFERLGTRDDLKTLIADALKRSALGGATAAGHTSKFDLPGAIEQIWRTGVWGVVSLLAECFFLLSSLLLEISRDITIQLAWLIHPLLIGIGPLFPRVTSQFLMHLFCVALWWPLFTVITIVTGQVARHYMTHTNSWGLSILAVELIGCLMTCAVPAIAHQLVSGAVSQVGQHLSVLSFKSSVTTHVESASLRLSGGKGRP